MLRIFFLADWISAVQNLIKINTLRALQLRPHCGMQFDLDALIWPMLYICCEILIIYLTLLNFVSLTCLLIRIKCVSEVTFNLSKSSLDFSAWLKPVNVLNLSFVFKFNLKVSEFYEPAARTLQNTILKTTCHKKLQMLESSRTVLQSPQQKYRQ